MFAEICVPIYGSCPFRLHGSESVNNGGCNIVTKSLAVFRISGEHLDHHQISKLFDFSILASL